MQIIVTDSGCSCDLAGTWSAADKHTGWGLGREFKVSASSMGKHFDRQLYNKNTVQSDTRQAGASYSFTTVKFTVKFKAKCKAYLFVQDENI